MTPNSESNIEICCYGVTSVGSNSWKFLFVKANHLICNHCISKTSASVCLSSSPVFFILFYDFLICIFNIFAVQASHRFTLLSCCFGVCLLKFGNKTLNIIFQAEIVSSKLTPICKIWLVIKGFRATFEENYGFDKTYLKCKNMEIMQEMSNQKLQHSFRRNIMNLIALLK